MSLLALLLFAPAVMRQDCEAVAGAVARDRCLLEESLRLKGVDCEAQETQFAMNICSFREYLRADVELNQAWDIAAGHAKRPGFPASPDDSTAKEFERLLAAQRAWVAFRDAHCAAATGPREDGGSMWPLLNNGCLTELTRRRTKQLRDYVEPNN